MQIHKITTIGISLIALLPAAFAEGFYADGGYTAFVRDHSFSDDVFEFGAIGGHAGYDFTKYFGIEGELLIGVKGDTYSLRFQEDGELVDVDFDRDLDAAYGLFAKANLPINDKFAAFARLGYVATEIELSPSSADYDTTSFSSEGGAFGIGAVFNISNKIYARGEFTRYEFEKDGLGKDDAFSLGVGYRF